MSRITLFFFSSSPISIPLFEALLQDPAFEVKALVCQPDKEQGRDMEVHEAEIKKIAQKHGIPVFQPEKLSRDTELLASFKKDPPDFILTFAYGQLLNEDWLSLPTIAPLNVHPSLLPLYRGPTPIQSAILNGDHETGLTLIKMGKGMDDGPIAFQEKVEIPAHSSSVLMFEEFARLAAEKIPGALLNIVKNPAFKFVEQDEASAVKCFLIERDHGRIDFKESAQKILNRFRAYQPWPGLFTSYLGKRIKVLDLELSDAVLEPGKVSFHGHELLIGTFDGALKVKLLQMEGKKALHPEAFILGLPDFASATLPS
ncbi:MAG: methionyl-tRNA formyltransferase [Candidatus Gracilibacteria bacterium]|jgi:methionyl-tRNA formyltransferase